MTPEQFAEWVVKRRLAVAECLFMLAWKEELLWGTPIDADAIGTRAAMMSEEEVQAFLEMHALDRTVNG